MSVAGAATTTSHASSTDSPNSNFAGAAKLPAAQQFQFEPKTHPVTGEQLEQVCVISGNPAVELFEACVYVAVPLDASHAPALVARINCDFELDGCGSGVGKDAPPSSSALSSSSPTATPSSSSSSSTSSPPSPTIASPRDAEDEKTKDTEEEKTAASRLAFMFDVPAHFTISELHQFFSCSEAASALTHLQVLAFAEAQDKYHLLLRFDCADACRAFVDTFDWKRFNSVEEGVCKVVPVYAADFVFPEPPSSAGAPSKAPTLLAFPRRLRGANDESCAVCLEPVVCAKGTQVITLCNHVFHLDCLAKWADSTCPVCRYVVQPGSTSSCMVCGSMESLWICLICGHVGCGRYTEGHAKHHFEETDHTFSLDVATQRVWDYVSDQYVHRIARNKKDGKLIELGRRGTADSSDGALGTREVASGVKLESLLVEYNYLLSSQLEKQRLFFQARLQFKQRALSRIAAEEVDKGDQLEAQIEYLDRRTQSLEKASAEGQNKLAQLATQIAAEEARALKLKALNTKLLQQQTHTRDTMELRVRVRAEEQHRVLEGLEATQRSLEEEVRDMQFYLTSQKTISKNKHKDQIAEGHMIVMGGDPSEQKSPERRRASGGRRKKGKR